MIFVYVYCIYTKQNNQTFFCKSTDLLCINQQLTLVSLSTFEKSYPYLYIIDCS